MSDRIAETTKHKGRVASKSTRELSYCYSEPDNRDAELEQYRARECEMREALQLCAGFIHRLRKSWPNPALAGDWMSLQNIVQAALSQSDAPTEAEIGRQAKSSALHFAAGFIDSKKMGHPILITSILDDIANELRQRARGGK